MSQLSLRAKNPTLCSLRLNSNSKYFQTTQESLLTSLKCILLGAGAVLSSLVCDFPTIQRLQWHQCLLWRMVQLEHKLTVFKQRLRRGQASVFTAILFITKEKHSADSVVRVLKTRSKMIRKTGCSTGQPTPIMTIITIELYKTI